METQTPPVDRAAQILGDPEQSPASWEEALDVVFLHLRRLMVERHRKYGPGNIAQGGQPGVLIRAGDKHERLRTAYTRPDGSISEWPPGDQFPDESVDDAWADLANYGAIALMVRWGWWQLPADCLRGRPLRDEDAQPRRDPCPACGLRDAHKDYCPYRGDED
jgi:hypothetical protein